MGRMSWVPSIVVILAATGCGDHPHPGSSRPDPDRTIGAQCTNDRDCDSRCETGGDFPGGFCTVSCRVLDDCPDGTVCVDKRDGICLYPCNVHSDCDIVGPRFVCKREDNGREGDYNVCIGD